MPINRSAAPPGEAKRGDSAAVSRSSGRNKPRFRAGGRILGSMKHARDASRRHLPTSPFKPPPAAPPVEQFAINDRVSHDQYGLGVVIGVEEGIAVLVDFRPRQ